MDILFNFRKNQFQVYWIGLGVSLLNEQFRLKELPAFLKKAEKLEKFFIVRVDGNEKLSLEEQARNLVVKTLWELNKQVPLEEIESRVF